MKGAPWRSWWRQRNVIRDHTLLKEIVRRIIAFAGPDQIILFGSAARGQLRPDSDFDLLVVKAGVTEPREYARRIQTHLFGIPMPVDVIVTTPEDLQAARNQGWTLLGRVVREGKRLYSSRQA